MKAAVAIVFVMGSATALAQPVGAQAEALFRQGRDLLVRGDVAEACSAFEESQKLQPTVATLLNLAGCRERLGQLATAWGLFLDAVRQTRSATDATTRQFHDVAEARARNLEPRVSKLTINVPVKSQFDGLEIVRGSERVDSGLWNRALPIDGGTYEVTARAPGANRWSTRISVGNENDSKTVEIPDLRNLPRDLEPVSATSTVPIDGSTTPSSGSSGVEVVPVTAVEKTTTRQPAPDAPDTVRQTPQSRSRGNLVTLSMVALGGVALLGTGLGFEISAESKYDSAKSEQSNQSRRDSLFNSANTRRYVAEVFAASGVVACGAAVWMYVNYRSERTAVIKASVRLVPATAGFALVGQF